MDKQKKQKTEFQRKVNEVYKSIERVAPQRKSGRTGGRRLQEDSSADPKNECYIALSNSTDPVEIKYIYP